MMRHVPFLALLLLAGGCARDADSFPSLRPRAAEKLSFDEPARSAPAPVQADPVLDARIADQAKRLASVVSGFDADAAKAERAAAAARGQPVGAEAWLDAQSALATLDDWRAQTSALVTDVEQLSVERAATLAAPYPALADLSERTEAELARQDETIRRIGGELPAA